MVAFDESVLSCTLLNISNLDKHNFIVVMKLQSCFLTWEYKMCQWLNMNCDQVGNHDIMLHWESIAAGELF